MANIDKIYDELTDILDYIQSMMNPNNPSEVVVLHNITKMISSVQEMIDNAVFNCSEEGGE